MRTLTATLVVPIVITIGILLPSMFSSRTEFEDVASLVFTLLFQYLFSLAFTAAVVVPLRLIWRCWDFMRGWVATVMGAALGSGMAAAFGFAYTHTPIFSSRPIHAWGYARLTSMLSLTGAAAGLVFWLIAKAEMRPNTSLERTRER